MSKINLAELYALIQKLEAKGLLPYKPGMMTICPDGDHRVVLAVTEAPNEWLYFQETPDGTRRFAPTHCTHAPCDALIGYLVGRLQGTKHNLEIRCYSDHAIVEWRKHPAAPLCFKGKTLLEALLLAFEAMLEAEK